MNRGPNFSAALPWYVLAVLSLCLFLVSSVVRGAGGSFLNTGSLDTGGSSWYSDSGSSSNSDSSGWNSSSSDSGGWGSSGSDSGSWDSGGSDSGGWDSGGSDSGGWDSGGGGDDGSW